MADSRPTEIAQTLLQQYGQTFAKELDIDIAKNAPAPLFQMLCGAILFSARINSTIAVNSMQALRDRGWTTADKMARSTWDERVEALTKGGYTRYRERTATMFGDTVEKLTTDYDGDLRQLRDQAKHDPVQERERLKEFKGIGDVGVDIFFREVQTVWDELYPFVDQKAQTAAQQLGLPQDAEALAALSDRSNFPKLVAALVRVDLEDAYAEVREANQQSSN